MMQQSESSIPLMASAAQLEITPRLGTQIGGRGLYRPVEQVIDPLYTRALVLQKGERKLCLLTLDVLAVTRDWVEKIRDEAAARFGFEPEAIMIHALQTHAAPMFGHHQMRANTPYISASNAWLKGGDDGYNDFAYERSLAVIGQALQNPRPVSAMVGSGLEDRVAFNRRTILRDGSARTLGLKAGDSRIHSIEGPIDPEVGVISFHTAEMDMTAMLLHHTCHPTHLNGTTNVSASWPGAWANQMQRRFGPECVPLVINGLCGNIHCRDRLNPDYHHNDDYQRLGQYLAETTLDVLKTQMVPLKATQLEWRSRLIEIPIRSLPPEEVEAARKLLAESPEPLWKDETHTAVEWDWVYAVSLLDLAERQQKTPTLTYEIQVFRLGDVAIVGLGGEPFVEAQLDIKLHSPAYRTFLAHYSNQFVGYIPTRRAFARGGYETWTANPSKLVPEALETIVSATRELLAEMFGEEPR